MMAARMAGFGERQSASASANFQPAFFAFYTRDPLGRITGVVETAGDVTRIFEYGYDELGRLGVVRRDGALVVRYTYDDNGNRVQAEGERRL